MSRFSGATASAWDVKSRGSHFESEPHDSQGLEVKPLAVQVLSDWHGRAQPGLVHERGASGDVGDGPWLPRCQRANKELAMPIHRLLEKHAFGPDEIRVLTSAFDDALRKLGLADRADPVVEVVARKIIELAQQGERDPTRLSERAIQALSR